MIDVLITGASGFIGSALVQRLQLDGLKIWPMERKNGCIADKSTWSNAPAAKTVVHLAGRSSVPESWICSSEFMKNNVVGTEQVINYCRHHNARLVFASTYVYGAPLFLPVSENHEVRPNNPYALSKYLAEQQCQFAAEYYDVPSTVLRLFNVFGPYQRQDFLMPTIINQVKAGKGICVKDLIPRRDYVYLDDIIEAFVLALGATRKFDVINIGSGVSHSVKDLIGIIQSIAGTNLPTVCHNITRNGEIQDIVADIGKAKALLGWVPRYSLESGLRIFFEAGFVS